MPATGAWTGKVTEGPSVAQIAAAQAPEAKAAVDARMAETLQRLQVIKDTADSGKMAYDQMLAADNPAGNAMIQAAIDSLVAQARAIEAVATALNLGIAVEGSDSLDNPAAVLSAVTPCRWPVLCSVRPGPAGGPRSGRDGAAAPRGRSRAAAADAAAPAPRPADAGRCRQGAR